MQLFRQGIFVEWNTEHGILGRDGAGHVPLGVEPISNNLLVPSQINFHTICSVLSFSTNPNMP